MSERARNGDRECDTIMARKGEGRTVEYCEGGDDAMIRWQTKERERERFDAPA